ncbi:S-adenosyl-L-methionine-dependent methyltransferase [Halteromyces radiatus]|uniref:S-adenosyl-L-methionine-dependent methyltransferase n=1 Tax=Halteromyces radiatus TaxID=101107 RepID=UPI002220B185|nr:S-adenosyl-L-methionine-dependent methyltransferase [Halteromyces radiatus]KAI8085127.1 S-adenosyl-L-methionine-dependent methyltransferase [Halteromyces radiatus]
MLPFSYFKKAKATIKQTATIPSKNNGSCQSNGSSKSEVEQQQHDDELSEPKFPMIGYEYIEGRHYKQQSKNGPAHLLPCDDEEVERLEVIHLLHKYLFGSYFISPVEQQLKQGARVLHICCGPGWWIKEMAKLYPNSQYIGIDDILYAITNPPCNSHFQVTDFTKGLPFEDNTFDFVVQREARFKHTKDNWEKVIQEAIRVTKPGGYLEFVESGSEINDIGPNLSLWLMRVTVSLQTRGMANKIGLELEDRFAKTNAVTIYESTHRSAPIGWLGRVGDLMMDCVQRFSDALKPRLCEDWCMPVAKYDAAFKAVLPECQEFKSWTNFYCVVAQKNHPDGPIPSDIIPSQE